MKVKCILRTDQDWGWFQKRKFLWLLFGKKGINGPKYGDILTVIGTEWEEGEAFYQLKEWPTKPGDGWEADCFVPIDHEFEKVEFEKIKEENPVGVN